MAQSFITLPLIPRPFADGGDKQAPLPASSTGTNRASFQDGWGDITSKPISEGGVPPNRLDFNGLGYLLSVYCYAIQQGQTVTFDATVSNQIGGYPKGAVLWYISNGTPQYLVQSLIDNNTTADLTDNSKWQPLTINPMGFAMLGTLSDVQTAQIRNIEIVAAEPETGIDGTIYAIIEN